MRTYIHAIVALTIVVFYSEVGRSQAKPASPSSGSASGSLDRSSDKLDIKKLEEQYWSAKDDDFTVVQNRVFSKARRINIGLMYSRMINSYDTQGSGAGASLGYYLSEKVGFELNYMKMELGDTNNISFLKDRYGASNAYNVLKTVKTASVNLSPFYGKMSLMEKSIIYFDMSFGLGLGESEFDQATQTGSKAQKAMHYELDVTQHFFVKDYLAFRFSIKNQFSDQERLDYTKGTSIGKSQIQNTEMIFGLTYFFSPITRREP